MTFRAAAFRDWMKAQGLQPNTISNYTSGLNVIDPTVAGLDECIASEGEAGVFSRLETAIADGALTYPSDRRSVLRKYLDFIADPLNEAATFAVDDIPTPAEAQSYLFKFEREMQVAVRRQLEAVESGLTAIDAGSEYAVDTGKIDILARDATGKLTVIELKAGLCPGSALEQVLGYSDDVARVMEEPVRSILIASAFTDRTQAAARRAHDLKLVVYDYVLTFNPIGGT